MTVHLLAPGPKRWVCPGCKIEHWDAHPTRVPAHPCPALKGLTVTFSLDHRAHAVAVEREDYVGADSVTADDDGRVVMAVETHHEDRAPDVTILAPCINVRASAHQ
jgi:hypothetical protein